MHDAIIIGGGAYGTKIATYLARKKKLKKILIIEQEDALFKRASYNNQARVHNGYHYPRSFTTAFRSRINAPNFIQEHSSSVKKDFTKIYAIAKRNSKVTAKQFARFCQAIGAKFEIAPPHIKQFFETSLIEEVFLVEEFAFDSTSLRIYTENELKILNIDLLLNTKVTEINQHTPNLLSVNCVNKNSETEQFLARYVFNCTYSGLNQIGGKYSKTKVDLKHEITEIALVKMPAELENIGVTVMDGPFFSFMPFPPKKLHTVTHVRYTPHCAWNDNLETNPYQKLKEYNCATRVDRMIRDISRYIPRIEEAKYIESLYEVKTILLKNEGDDGRPILYETNANLPNLFSILGGKIDNIYDILEKLDEENIK